MKIHNPSSVFHFFSGRKTIFSMLSLSGTFLMLGSPNVFAGDCAEVAKLKAREFFKNNSTDSKPIYNPWASEPKVIDGKRVYHVAVPYCNVEASSCPKLESALRSNYEISIIDDGDCKLVQEPKYLGDTDSLGSPSGRSAAKPKPYARSGLNESQHDPCEALVKKKSGYKDAQILKITEDQETAVISFLVSDRSNGGKSKKIIQLSEEDQSLWKKGGCLAVYVSTLHTGKSEPIGEVFTPDYKPMLTEKVTPKTHGPAIGAAPSRGPAGHLPDAGEIH